MLLENRNAIIYGAGGSIGSGVAKAFAREGARLFLAGRTRSSLEAVAGEIAAAGGKAEVAVVDVLDEQAVDAHARQVVEQAGSIDISFNLATRGDFHGTPLAQMSVADFTRPIVNGITGNFITARAAARQMVTQGSGVIIALDGGSAEAKGSPMMGGTGPADGALDAFVRNLALEVGPEGVRVVGIWTAGLPDTLSPEKLTKFSSAPQMDEDAFKQLIEQLDSMRTLRRSPKVPEVASTAVFLASDQAPTITGTFVNVTGMFVS